MTTNRLCKACGKPFDQKHCRQTYCSAVCRYKTQREANRIYRRKPAGIPDPVKKCECCEKQFVPTHYAIKMCVPCRNKRDMRWALIRARNDHFNQFALYGNDDLGEYTGGAEL